jgi:hypothetical protein
MPKSEPRMPPREPQGPRPEPQVEAQARMALEARVRALEEQLQRQTGDDAHSPSVEPQAKEQY